jgi:hypothetical protein
VVSCLNIFFSLFSVYFSIIPVLFDVVVFSADQATCDGRSPHGLPPPAPLL